MAEANRLVAEANRQRDEANREREELELAVEVVRIVKGAMEEA